VEKRLLADAFVDTSFVIALVNQRDQHHLRALDLAAQFEQRPLLTTDAVLLEIGNALAKNFRIASIQAIDDFLTATNIQIVHLYPDLFHKAFSLCRSRLDQTWGLIDCVSFIVMREVGIVESLTADKHFEQAGFQALLRS
jgi:predicted nucleic acid-binding protein